MNHASARLLAISLVTATSWACAAQPDQHKGHHPAPSAAAPAARSTIADSTADAARADSQTKAMRGMHDKMVAAQTPEERTALMADHMQVMHDGMAVMKGMGGTGAGGMKGDMAARHQMMAKRMDLMQATIEVMMDRLPAAPAK